MFKRLLRLLKGTGNAMLDKMEDPVIVTDEMLREYSQKITTTRNSIAGFEAEIICLENKVKKNQLEIARLNELCDKAIIAKKDDLAIEYESQIQRLELENNSYQGQIDSNNPRLVEMKAVLQELNNKRDAAKLQAQDIKVKRNIINARKTAEETIGSGVNSISGELDRLSEKTDKEMFTLEASDRMDKGDGYAVRQEFEKGLAVGEVNNRLSARRARLAGENGETTN